MDRAYVKYRRWQGTHRVSVKRPEGKRSLGRLGRRLEDNINTDLQEGG